MNQKILLDLTEGVIEPGYFAHFENIEREIY